MHNFSQIDQQIKARSNALFCLQKHQSNWKTIRYTDFRNGYLKLASFFKSLEIDQQSPIAIFSKTRYEWNLVDFAIQANRCITVGLYSNDSDKNIKHCLSLSNPKLLVVEDYKQLTRVQSIDPEWGWSKPVIVIDADYCQSEPVYHLKHIIHQPLDSRSITDIEDSIHAIDASDIESYIFTSGTSGEQKAVILTHQNLYHTASVYQQYYPIDETDRTLIFLPMSHVFARVMFYASITWGQQHYYLQSVDELIDELKNINPTTLLVVPRLLEKVMANIENSIRDKSLITRILYHYALFVGRIHHTSPVPNWLTYPFYELGNTLVLKKLRQIFGKTLRFAGAGGGHLSPAVCRFFWSIGIPVYEGYASTESGGLGIFNHPKDALIGSIGKPVDAVKSRIQADGELQLQSASTALGYLTEEGIEKFDEWVSTGDIAEIDLSGYYRISDRKKDLIVNAYGKNIAPSWIEDQFLIHIEIENIVVIGNNRPYLTALIVAANTGKPEDVVLNEISNIVNSINRQLSRHEQIKRFALVPAFAIENQQLTSTMKKRRKAIETHYQDTIDNLYLVKANQLVTP